ncbi:MULTISPECIES: hypothetical protein [Rhizobium]|uniref:Uncharacterized protein n=1 Tax=Rhizobium paranaense TaxID=1650438 RepID=A0A7W9D3I8_9HYPH|nr:MULTISPECIES: hypothetical protein [Rhizobium]MBB5576230.1 hypothetical protein [Rhizobium paranaense]MDK4741740.1 hypothetical protein [Rhizobium sp. CNPSo 3464]
MEFRQGIGRASIHDDAPVRGYTRDSTPRRLRKPAEIAIKGRSNSNTVPQSGSLLDDIPPTLFIRAMFKAANAVQIRVSIDEIEPDRCLVLPVHWNLQHLL